MSFRSQDPVTAWHRRGLAAATGRRSRLLRLLRRCRYLLIQLGFLLHRKLVCRRATIGWFEFVPRPESSTERADVVARAGWYLSDLGLPVRIDGPAFVADDAPWMESSSLETAGFTPTSSHQSGAVGHRLLHRSTARAVLRSLASRSPVTIVDPALFNAADCWGYESLRRMHRPTEAHPVRAHSRFLALIREVQAGHSRAIVVATGPSVDQLDFAGNNYDLRITCNSAVRNMELLHALRPNVIAFADPVFHFGPSRYAAAFRQDACRAAALTGALLLVPSGYAGLLLHHHPELTEQVIPFSPDSSEWSWPSPAADVFSVRATDNILTLAMLPAALAAATEVHIAGSDGREVGERYFWRHSTRLQYSDELMGSAFTAHPSFFRDRHYGDYYAHHCDEIESLISLAECQGKRVRSVTPSHIPALQRRPVERPYL